MTNQYKDRSSTDRRKLKPSPKSAGMADRRWCQDPRSPVLDDDRLYDPDWDVSDADLEAYARISLDD